MAMVAMLISCGPGKMPVGPHEPDGDQQGKWEVDSGGVPLHLIALHKGESCEMDDDCAPELSCIYGFCAQVVSGKGGPCFLAEHCEPGLHCLDGTCSALMCGQVGHYCSSDDDCLAPNFCNYGYCTKGPSAIGEECTYDTDCVQPAVCANGKCQEKILSKLDGTCVYDADCVPGLMCVVGQCKEGPLPLGEKCGIQAHCQQGSLCHKAVCSAVGDGKVAALCAYPSDCKYGLDCLESQCSRRLSVGNPCKFDEDCDGGAMCAMGKCSASLVPDGGACNTTMDCASEYDISVCYQNKCTPIGNGNTGSICEIDGDCSYPLVCNAYTCAKKYAKNGQTCYEDNHCDDGYCVLGKCSSQLLPDGAKCGQDLDCDSGLCIMQKCVWDLKPLGDSCEWDADCNDGLCVAQRCVASGGGMGDPCSRDKDCDLPWICIKGLCTDHLGQSGDDCSRVEDCLPGLICKKSVCA
jgi:hypothetical protein